MLAVSMLAVSMLLVEATGAVLAVDSPPVLAAATLPPPPAPGSTVSSAKYLHSPPRRVQVEFSLLQLINPEKKR
jgi:hypothetical protein